MISEYTKFKNELPSIFNQLENYYMITHLDNNGIIIYTNTLFLEVSKWTPKRIIGKSLWQMFPQETEAQELAETIWSTVMSGSSWSGIVEKVSRLDEAYFVKLVALPVTKARGGTSVLLIELDITEDVALRERLQKIAFIDYETGLMSRYNLEMTVNELIESKESFSFVHLSIDHFYSLMEKHSYEAEKEIINSFTNRLKRFFQDSNIARIGVNEFVILTPFGDWYIEGFLEFLKLQPIYAKSSVIKLSVSGSIIRYPEDQQSYSHLIKASMTATRDVIKAGGNRVITLSPESHKLINRKAIIDSKLEAAIQNDELQVVYQPQVQINSNDIILYEAFVRWHDNELGTVSPEELIPIAEENGLINAVGTYVLEDAARLIASKKEEGINITVAINSSVREFANKNFVDTMLTVLAKHKCPPTQIQIEITETFAFQAEEEHSIIQQMNTLHAKGIEFALDDFGTGYASFRFMQSLPIHKIKIDYIFIQALTTHQQTRNLVEGMIHFSKSMGLEVIAEGVETVEQYDILKTLGIDAVQGYYIGEPVHFLEVTN